MRKIVINFYYYKKKDIKNLKLVQHLEKLH